MEVLVFHFVSLDYPVRVEDRVSLDLDHLVDESLHDPDTHLVIARLVLVVDRYQVQMDAEKHSLDLQLVDQLLENLAELQQALDDEAWQFGLDRGVLVTAKQVEEHAEDRRLVAVLEAAQHRAVQVVHDELAFVLVSKLVEVVDEESREELLNELVQLLFTYDRHDDATLARLVHNRHEVLREAQGRVLTGSLEDVDQDVTQGTDKVICRVLNGLLVALDRCNDVVESNERFDSLVEVTAVLEVADVFGNVVHLPLRLRIKGLLLRSCFS